MTETALRMPMSAWPPFYHTLKSLSQIRFNYLVSLRRVVFAPPHALDIGFLTRRVYAFVFQRQHVLTYLHTVSSELCFAEGMFPTCNISV